MIELLLGVALVWAVPLGAVIAIGLLRARPMDRSWATLLFGVTAGPAVLSLVIGRGTIATMLVVPWWFAAVAIAGVVAWSVLRDLVSGRGLREPWRIGVAIAAGFLAVGATWLVLDRANLQPFGFDQTIVLLTAVHFHVAGFVLTVAGSFAARRRPTVGVQAAVLALVVGTPLTALGFFGLPLVSWVGAGLVASGGIGIGLVTIAIARETVEPLAAALLTLAGSTLLVTMPLAVAYATGTAFNIPFLGIPAMAAIHGGLNVVGFAIPAMIGWHLADRTGRSTARTET